MMYCPCLGNTNKLRKVKWLGTKPVIETIVIISLGRVALCNRLTVVDRLVHESNLFGESVLWTEFIDEVLVG